MRFHGREFHASTYLEADLGDGTLLPYLPEFVDGVLEVDFIGQPAAALAAISVLEVSVPDAPPPPPPDLAAIDGYGMAILSWQEPDLTVVQSHRVYRAATVAGPYTLVDDQLDFADYFYDLTAPVDRTYWYRVTATDGFGHESAPAGPVACTPLAASASSLPVTRAGRAKGSSPLLGGRSPARTTARRRATDAAGATPVPRSRSDRRRPARPAVSGPSS